MNLREQIAEGKMYVEWGHRSEESRQWEKVLEEQRQQCKEQVFDFNQTRPMDTGRKEEILRALLGSVGRTPWFEAPVHFAYGCNIHVGDCVYANFNLTIVDDGEVFIGDHVMFAPNVTVTTTGHPVHPMYRLSGAQFSLPVHIGNGVWVGANVVIMPGVTIGENSVIGAGSVVTHDVPANVVAFGAPCRVQRPITEEDMRFYRRGMRVNEDWNA